MSCATSPTPCEEFVTAKPIAKLYKVTEPTVYRWAKEGKIPSVRFESTIRFDLAAVRAKIEGKEVSA